ncbi:MAG: hypothetical protein AB7O37_10675 [Vicinamibacteria bacterium]
MGLLLAALLALAPPAPVELPVEHLHPSQAFSFRTPDGWSSGPVEGQPQLFEAKGDGLIVRFLFLESESGFDSLHVECMELRLAGPMQTQPHVRYEHDFLSGTIGERRVLDSAFVVGYDDEQHGSREWRQRNLTIVGAGQSLCIVGHAPARGKNAKDQRRLRDAVMTSVAFRAPSR